MPLAHISMRFLAIFFIVIGLTGCSGMRLVDSQVTSFAPKAVTAGASYRFERLPSQQAEKDDQDRLEAMTEQALARVGLQRNDANATYSVLVGFVQNSSYNPYDRPLGYRDPRLTFGFGLGWHRPPISTHLSNRPLFPWIGEPADYNREVSLVLRELASQSVVFESRARHDGRWSDTEAIVPAMLDAALQGFPNPPAGTRQVNIEIPR